MSHKSGHIIINRVPAPGSTEIVHSATVELSFPANTPLDARVKKIRQVERLLDKLDQDDED
jgi:hypothetical protein